MQWCNILTHSMSPYRDEGPHRSHQLCLTSPGTDLDPSPSICTGTSHWRQHRKFQGFKMCIVSEKNVWIVWHNPCIIDRHINDPSDCLWDGRARRIFSSSSIQWVRVVWEACVLPQMFGVAFEALSVNHAWTVTIPLSRHSADTTRSISVQVLGLSLGTMVINICMRKMPLLSFFHHHKRIHMSQYDIFQDVCEESLHLYLEYSGNGVWSLVGLLTLKNWSFYFRPVRVVSEGEEEVWFAFDSDQGHGVLEFFGIPSWWSINCGLQDG